MKSRQFLPAKYTEISYNYVAIRLQKQFNQATRQFFLPWFLFGLI